MESRMQRVSLALVIFIVHATLNVANQEGNVLSRFRNQLDDPHGFLTSWDPSLVNPCTWFHITCDDNSVTRIDLGKSGISGELVPELSQLKSLQYMDLYSNNLSGSIPTQFGDLSNLIALNLYENVLSGPIPAELGKLSKLTILDLHHNNLSGPIPIHALAPIIPHLVLVDVSDNPLLCTNDSNPPCP